jgi:DNA mismatch repair protein MSH3
MPELQQAPAKILIREVRHPLLEGVLGGGYIPCDVEIAPHGVWLLSGPNMGGKSALMRTLGTIAIMAQVGGFVPATKANLPVFSALHCCMSAADDLVHSRSTFFAEMVQMTHVLRSPHLGSSLVLVDELGQGTSTYDGFAIASAVLKFLIEHGAVTIFATHHTQLCEDYDRRTSVSAATPHDDVDRIQCKYMSFAEVDVERIAFLRQPVTGVTPTSFGVRVAQMAGLPCAVTDAAKKKGMEMESLQNWRKVVNFLKN